MSKKWKEVLKRTIFYIGLILLWQFVFMIGTKWLDLWKPYAFPNPKGVVEVLIRLCMNTTLLRAAGKSILRALTGFAISAMFGIVVGVVLHKMKQIRKYIGPLIMGMQTLPTVCWVPFAILWFGLTEQAIIFVVIMGSTCGIALSVESGIENINPLYIKVAKTMGANGFVLFKEVIIPASIPEVITGLRHGWSFAWRALMSGEVMASTIGLGHTLILGRDLADINQVMLVMIVIIVIGMAVDKCIFKQIEKRIRR